MRLRDASPGTPERGSIVRARDYVVVLALALLWGGLLAMAIRQPGYTDAYYYYNAGQRLATGQGLTDPYLWTYIHAPEGLPGPSHMFWMPLESLVAAAAMVIGGADFGVAQMPSVVCFALLVSTAFWLGAAIGQTQRRAWIAALLVLFSGFFTPFWTTTDTFALYGCAGAAAMIGMGKGRETGSWRWYAVSGAASGLAHLTRADGVLLLAVAGLVAVGPDRTWRKIARAWAALLGAYLLVMLPWFARNVSEIGSPLPTGGTQAMWLRGYNELVSYPPNASAATFWDWGLENILRSRIEALNSNLGTFVAVETWVVLGPFVLWGLWRERRRAMVLGVALYAVALHLAMTFVFAYPGYRGGLFHSSAALLPFWAALGVSGLDEAIAWAAARRRWNTAQAQSVFGAAMVVLAAAISVGVLASRLEAWNDNGAFYDGVVADLSPDAVLMVNDPAALYYYTGHAGVVVPDSEPDVVPDIATRFGVTHLVLDENRTAPFDGLYRGEESRPYLVPLGDLAGGLRLFAIDLAEREP